MGRMGSVDFNSLKQFKNNVQTSSVNMAQVEHNIVNMIGNEFLQQVKARTPSSDRNKLKNSWQLKIYQKGNSYIAEVFTNEPHAKHIEFGSATPKGYRAGAYMMTITSSMIQQRYDALCKKETAQALQKMFK